MNGGVAVVAVALDRAARLNITVTGLITNNPPSRPAIQTDKKYYYSGETITATASGSADPDGDPVTYYYYKFYDLTSGTTLQDWNTSNTYTIGSSSEGHVIRVYARACDNKGACSSENFTDVGVIKVLTLYPTDNIYGDAYVYDLASDTNYGKLPYLISGVSRGGGVYRTYIKFNLSSIPLGSTVLSARLNLVYYNARSGCVIEVYTASGMWYENNITWSNAPQPSSLSDSNSTTGP